ncbi:MAG: putative signaling protein [Anaerolineaceae bacterium]|nr:MAG: putative signaling protein [Anaerolineaceae bacterium]
MKNNMPSKLSSSERPSRGSLTLRTKLILGNILITFIAITGTGYYAYLRAQQANTYLITQIDAIVRQQAEDQLTSTIAKQAIVLNNFFTTASENITIINATAQNLLSQELILNNGIYWDATESLSRLPNGSWDNSNTDLASVFIPAKTDLTDTLTSELNTLKQLDFVVPTFLAANPDTVAIYFGGTSGETLYYPNIDLASIVPPDFDVTGRPWFVKAAPAQNPGRTAVWSDPYLDAALHGLVVTSSVPVYDSSGNFRGVVAMDIQLNRITDLVANIHVGETGYAFLVDKNGRLIAMPDAGYNDLGITPATVPLGEALDQTKLANVPPEFFDLLVDVASGNTGLQTITLGGTERFVAYHPISEAGYGLVIIVPSKELLAESLLAKEQIALATRNTLTQSIFLAVGTILILTLLATLGISNGLTLPLRILTKTAQEITDGNLAAEIKVRSRDEIGTLAKTLNTMTSTLRENIQSLEQRVDERTRQVRTAAEIAQDISTSFVLDDLLKKTVSLMVERFGYYHAGIFLLDETGRYAVLSAAQGPSAAQMMAQAHRLAVGSPSIIGWVTANKEPRLASNVAEDPIHLKNELLPETQAEVGVPIMAGGQVLGALDVQSTSVNAFDNDTILMLQALAGQIAAAINNVRTLEAAQVNLQDASEVYRVSYQITQAQNEEDVFEATRRVFERTPYTALFLIAESGGMRVAAAPQLSAYKGQPELPEWLSVTPANLATHLASGILVGEVGALATLPASLLQMFEHLKLASVGLIPVMRGARLEAVLILGSREKEILLPITVRPFASIAELIASTAERMRAEKNIEQRLGELEAITVTSQAISTANSLESLYKILHEHTRQKMGDINFLIALYEPATDSISVPYLYEKGEDLTSLDAFPLGEGLTSILIRTKQPLMIVEDTERRAIALGAKVVGQPAKSWLGTPMIVSGNVLGALIVQDPEHELAFDESDLRFMTTLSAQVAGAVYNTRLLEETRKRALQLQTAAEIARDISGSLELSELLAEAVTLIRERFNFYHAAVFLVDAGGKNVVVREATGEAGAQMKRAGHKLKVGSKSIVGYVTGSGEPLVVNDTTRDATYYANPLLPDTRSEIAIPLKVGARILGALDVQSESPYSFAEEDVNVLRILADQLAIAVINSELFAETQEHLSQHRLLHHVTTAAASGATLEEALNSAAQGLQVTLGGDRVAILLANREKNVLEIRAVAGYSEEVKQIEVPFGEGITGWVAVHQQPQRIDDVLNDPRYIQAGANVRSELAIPMIYRGEILGILNVESDQPAAYSENDEELLGTLGGSLAAIIANARLLEQIRRQVDRERLLYEVTSKIRRSSDVQTIMATTANELSKALGARRAQISIDVGAKQKDTPAQSGKETG